MSTKIYRVLVVTLSLLSSSYFAKAANITARGGNWSFGASWVGLVAPTAADNVTIPNGATITVNTTTCVAATLTIAAGGKLIITNGDKLTVGGALSNAGTITTNTGSLIIGGSLTNTGTMSVSAGGTLTFDGAANSTISSSGGTYTITGTVVLNMGSSAIALDVQDPNFITGINSGGKYYFTFTRGTFRMDNTGTLNNAYNSGVANALTIPFGVILESDKGTMNLATNGGTGNVLLSGQLFMNGGIVNVQTGQALSGGPASDFQYYVNGGTPQLYINSGSLTVGGGFNPINTTSYIDFNMTGGTMLVTSLENSNNASFQLQNVAGGKTAMSGGRIIVEEPGLRSNPDLDMGGSAISTYSVTGGTVQLGTSTMATSNSMFAIQPYSTTNYPNIDLEPGTPETVVADANGNLNLLSLYINSNATFDASSRSSGFNVTNLTITGSDGTYAFDNEGGFTPGSNTVTFSGSGSQLITSTANSSIGFNNLTISNTGANVVLGEAATVGSTLAFTSGKLDASSYPVTITSGNAVTGPSNNSYVITGNGVTKTGYLAMQGIPKNTTTTFPIGTSSYYLPVTLNPGNKNNNSYSAYVYPGVTTNGLSSGASESASILSDMADGTWVVNQTAGNGTTTVGFNWASAGTTLEGTNFQTFGPNIGVTQYTGGSWSTATGTGNVATTSASASFTTLGVFSVVGTPIALPIVLGNFQAEPQGRTAYLAWAAYPDGQTASFTVERSVDGVDWTTLGVVQADAGARVETSYAFTDAAPAAGQDDYRLFIQNADGSVSYSPIRVVEFAASAQMSIFPNPCNAVLTINVGAASGAGGSGSGAGGLGAGGFVFRLVNTAGQVLQSRVLEAGGSSLTMNTGGYPAGVYYLETLEGGQVAQTSAVMIVH